jgi:hypothetical protein
MSCTVCALALAPGIAADALQPPLTAAAHSLQCPVELLDDPGNSFRFPQLASNARTSIATHGATFSAPHAGAVAACGNHRLFHQFRGAGPTDSRSARIGGLPRHQVGWAATIRTTRLGVAYAWSVRGERDRHEQSAPERLTRYMESEFETTELRQATVGLGWGRSASLDLALDVVWDRYEYQYSLLHETDYGFDGSFFEHDVEAKLDRRVGAAVCASLPFMERAELRVHVDFQDGVLDFARHSLYYSRRNGRIVDSEEAHDGRRDHGVEWSAGARVEYGDAEHPRWGVHARFSSRRGPWRYVAFSDDVSREWTRAESSEIGLSHRRPGPVGLEMRAGFAVRRDVERVLDERDRGSSVIREIEVRKDVSSTFAWGLHRLLGPLDLAASVSTRLNPLYPIALLDATIHF